MEKCRTNVPKKRKEWEDRLGWVRGSDGLDDVVKTRGATEGEEWEFVKRKYIPELVDNNGNGKKKKRGGEE